MASASPRELPFTLVRHGESNWNESALVQGQDNTAQLTTRGREQARLAAESLRNLGFRHLFSSDLDRAAQTASIIGTELGLSAQVDQSLRERCFGVYEGGPSRELTSDVTGIVDDVLVNPDARPEGGESFRDVVVRAGHFIEAHNAMALESRALIVTHGGTIRALRAYTSALVLEGMAWYRVDNCSVWSLDGRDVT